MYTLFYLYYICNYTINITFFLNSSITKYKVYYGIHLHINITKIILIQYNSDDSC